MIFYRFAKGFCLLAEHLGRKKMFLEGFVEIVFEFLFEFAIELVFDSGELAAAWFDKHKR